MEEERRKEFYRQEIAMILSNVNTEWVLKYFYDFIKKAAIKWR